MKHSRNNLYILNKGRIIILLLMTLIFTSGLSIHFDRSNTIFTKFETVVWYPYSIEEGDTIWSISELTSSGSEDIREISTKIINYNNLSSTNIYPGDVIFIPDLLNK